MNEPVDSNLIPEEFWCFETGEPFQRCFMCSCDLMHEGTHYLVEKAFRKKEVLFEYAMCFECLQDIRKQLSNQSLKLIENYFDEHVDFVKRTNDFLEAYGPETRFWIDKCMIKGTPISECEEHQIYGWFIDESIVFPGMPYMLSGVVMDELLNLLSNETIGVLEDFSEKLFGIDIPQNFILI